MPAVGQSSAWLGYRTSAGPQWPRDRECEGRSVRKKGPCPLAGGPCGSLREGVLRAISGTPRRQVHFGRWEQIMRLTTILCAMAVAGSAAANHGYTFRVVASGLHKPYGIEAVGQGN